VDVSAIQMKQSEDMILSQMGDTLAPAQAMPILDDFKLQIPIAKSETEQWAKSISFKGRRRAAWSDERFFFMKDDWLRMQCPLYGITTSGSKNVRTELRDRTEWEISKGYHTF